MEAIVAALLAVVAAAGVVGGVVLVGRARRAEAEVARLRDELQVERHAAAHDPLTGLPNRRAFYRSAPALVGDGDRRPLVAVLVDLDDFKRINDTLGHAVGDRVLVTMARRFSELARGGLVARLGGDEFVGLFDWPGADIGRLHEAGRALTSALAAPIPLPEGGVAVTASVGLASVSGPADLDELLDRADAAMYRAKFRRCGAVPAGWTDQEPATLAQAALPPEPAFPEAPTVPPEPALRPAPALPPEPAFPPASALPPERAFPPASALPPERAFPQAPALPPERAFPPAPALPPEPVLSPAPTFEWLPPQRERRAAGVPRHRAAGF